MQLGAWRLKHEATILDLYAALSRKQPVSVAGLAAGDRLVPGHERHFAGELIKCG
jgi:hypothetical protein